MNFGLKTFFSHWSYYLWTCKFPAFRKAVWGDTTQHGEFLFLNAFFKNTKTGFLVDVGANDGKFCSNSFPFIKKGWKALLIEPNPCLAKSLEILYANNSNVIIKNCACGEKAGESRLFLGKDNNSAYSTLNKEDSWWFTATRGNDFINVQVETLSNLLSQVSCSKNFDFLSIDTEGHDYFVLLGLDTKKYRPKLIMTEDEKPPFTFAKPKLELLNSLGYHFIKRFQDNSLFIASD